MSTFLHIFYSLFIFCSSVHLPAFIFCLFPFLSINSLLVIIKIQINILKITSIIEIVGLHHSYRVLTSVLHITIITLTLYKLFCKINFYIIRKYIYWIVYTFTQLIYYKDLTYIHWIPIRNYKIIQTQLHIITLDELHKKNFCQTRERFFQEQSLYLAIIKLCGDMFLKSWLMMEWRWTRLLHWMCSFFRSHSLST